MVDNRRREAAQLRREVALRQRVAELERSQTPLSVSTALITLPRLFDVLAVPLGSGVVDLEKALKYGESCDVVSQGQARWLLRTEQFLHWFTATRSGILLIDGNTNSTDSGRISAMSYLCTTLVASIIQTQEEVDAVSLYFFCGLHIASNDELRGPNGMMRAILTDLLMELQQRKILSLDFVDNHDFREALECNDLRAICDAFLELVKQLPLDTPVYCIIDGLSLYEKMELLDDSYLVIDKLNELVSDQHLRPIFKVLLTSPHRSRFIRSKVSKEEHIFLQSGIADNGIISERFLKANISNTASLSPKPSFVSFKEEETGEDEEWTAEDFN